jgi:hypothetical protein
MMTPLFPNPARVNFHMDEWRRAVGSPHILQGSQVPFPP